MNLVKYRIIGGGHINMNLVGKGREILRSLLENNSILPFWLTFLIIVSSSEGVITHWEIGHDPALSTTGPVDSRHGGRTTRLQQFCNDLRFYTMRSSYPSHGNSGFGDGLQALQTPKGLDKQ